MDKHSQMFLTPSGLRFTNLTSASATVANPGTGVLSVNTTGDVIYVPGGTGGGANVCGGIQTNFVTKWTGTDICNSQIFDDGTNVGIATTTPIYKLDVNGSAAVANPNKFIAKDFPGTGIGAALFSDGASEGHLTLGPTAAIQSQSGEIQFTATQVDFFQSISMVSNPSNIDITNTAAGGKRIQIITNTNGIRFNDVTGAKQHDNETTPPLPDRGQSRQTKLPSY